MSVILKNTQTKLIIMKNKKAFEMALGTVVMVVILLIVLIIVGSFFIGGVTTSGEHVENVSGGMTDRLGGIGDGLGTLVDKFNPPGAKDDDS